ncbi:MAG: DUF4350 domain-containing protein [Fimbriimonadales bacterium]
MIRRDVIIIVVTLLVMIAVTTWQAVEAEKATSRDPLLPELSSLSANPDGAKAAYLVLEDLGHQPIRWGRSFALLQGKTGSLITFGSGGGGSAVDSGEVIAIQEWVSQGNTVIALGDASTVFGLAISASEANSASGDGRFAGLSFAGGGDHFPRVEDNDKALINSKSGVVGIERTIGKGKAYLFADDSLLSNETLGQVDNAALLTLVGNGRVYVDDFHRGHVASGSPLELLPDALRIALILSVLVGVVAIAKQSFRFGPFEEQPLPEPRSGAQIAWSLSRLLRHAGATSTAAEEAIKAFKLDVGLPQSEPPEAALERLATPHPELEKRVRHALENPNKLPDLITALADLRNAIKDESRGRYRKQ